MTYITYLDVDNSDLSLRPGMTATTTITTIERHDVLLVPNTALRFTPSLPASASSSTSTGSDGGGIVSSLMPKPPSSSTTRKPATGNGTAPAYKVWVLRNDTAVPIAVTPGSSDGRVAEVIDGELQVGMPVITDQASTPTMSTVIDQVNDKPGVFIPVGSDAPLIRLRGVTKVYGEGRLN